MGQKIAALSKGYRQRVGLAQALLHDPSILILDEPTSSMDMATERAVLDRMIDWAADKTLVMATHRNSLLELADRVLVIDQGTIITDTTPAKIKAQAG